MTTPRDDIAGLIERLRDRTSLYAFKQLTFRHSYDYEAGRALLDEAATQLDSLLKEREALQARVKELEDGRNFWKSERDRIKAFLSEGDWQTIESEQAWRKRALRAEQERDEAYERLKPFAKGWWSHQNPNVKISAIFNHNPFDERVLCTVGEMQAAYSLVRRLAGPEKEKKE